MYTSTLRRIPLGLLFLYVFFLLFMSFEAFSMDKQLWQEFGWFLFYNIPGLLLLFFLSLYSGQTLLCGEVMILVSAFLSLCFPPWEQVITWMLLVFPVLLAGILYLLLYYWEKHYTIFS